MNIARIMLAAMSVSLFVISAATSNQVEPVPTATASDWQTEQQHAAAAPASNPAALPEQLNQLRAALDSTREELQWVQELLQQTGETLYWAKSRHQQSAVTLRSLEDQLASVTASFRTEQAQAHLGVEADGLGASLPGGTRQRELGETQAQIQVLQEERDQLRRALADRDQRIAAIESELESARVDLKRARAETAEANEQLASTRGQYQSCQAQNLALNQALTGSRRSETDARQSLLNANAERYRLHTELAACSVDLDEVRTSFAALETEDTQVVAAAAQPASEPVTADAMAEASADGVRKSRSESPLSLDGVKFSYDSSELTEESRAILDQVAVALKRQSNTVHEVAGHTDSQGDPSYNQWLSQQRAETVRKYLISRGVAPRRLKARGYGGLQPIADNSTWAGLVSNRRVELREIH